MGGWGRVSFSISHYVQTNFNDFQKCYNDGLNLKSIFAVEPFFCQPALMPKDVHINTLLKNCLPLFIHFV